MTLIPAEYGRTAQHEERTWGDVKKGYTHFKNGDVVMAKITPCFENGKSAVMDRLTGGTGAGTTELHVFRSVSDVVQTQFVLIYLKSRGFIDRGIPRMTGSAGQNACRMTTSQIRHFRSRHRPSRSGSWRRWMS